MSRIIREGSDEVKAIRLSEKAAAAAQPKSISPIKFRRAQAESVFTEEEVQARLQQAVQKARQEGAKEAEQKLKAPLSAALDNLNTVLDELSRFRRELFKECEEEIIQLLELISKKLFEKEISESPERMNHLIQKALEVLEKEREIEVRLNAKDHQNFTSAKPELIKSEAISLVADSELQAGRAIVSTKTRQIEISAEQIITDLIKQVRDDRKEIQETGDDGDKV